MTDTDTRKLDSGQSPTHAVEVQFMSKRTAAKFAKAVQDGDLAGFVTFSAGDPVALRAESYSLDRAVVQG